MACSGTFWMRVCAVVTVAMLLGAMVPTEARAVPRARRGDQSAHGGDSTSGTSAGSGSTANSRCGVTSFSLINTLSNEPFSGYEALSSLVLVDMAALPTDQINLRANVVGDLAQVKFYDGTGKKLRTENKAPYALYGDNPTGDYHAHTGVEDIGTIQAMPFDEQGKVCAALSVTLTTCGVTSFSLINALTNEPFSGYETLSSLVFVDMAALPTDQVNLRANVVGDVDQVKFYDGPGTKLRTENKAPFALYGDNPTGDYHAHTGVEDIGTIRAVPFDDDNDHGAQACAALSVTLTTTV